jgi:putative transcriptional regulator
MSTFGDDLIQAMTEALAHAKGQGPAIVHTPVAPRAVREQARLTQARMAPLMGMSLSGYRKWEQGQRRASGDSPAIDPERAGHGEARVAIVKPLFEQRRSERIRSKTVVFGNGIMPPI